MAESPLVSVVIPLYNAEEYLEKCLLSVTSQTYINLQIILVNDGSTDRTSELCKAWCSCDKRIEYIEQDNLGQGIARNSGITLARGQLITFIDADDWVACDYIKKMYHALMKSDADICKCNFDMIDSYTNSVVGSIKATPIDKKNALSYDAPHIAGNLYKRYLFDEYGIKMPSVKYEDLATYPLLALVATKITVVDEALYFYRVNTGQSTMDNVEYLRQYPDAIQYLLNEAKRLDLFKDNYCLFMDISVLHLGVCLKRAAERKKDRNYYELKDIFVKFLNSTFPKWDKLYNQGSWIYNGKLFDDIVNKRERPKISVIIPVYNVESYLPSCLDSVMKQTLSDIEIICVNDGSQDSSRAILEEYRKMDSRVVVINKENSGYGQSMNVGLAVATGEYIGIVESDDFAETDMFEKLYQVACLSEAEVVKSNYFAYQYVDGNINEFVESLWGCEYNKIFSPNEDKRIFFAPQTIWSAIYKREFLLQNDILFNETPGASYQDIAFTFKVWAMAERAILIRDAFLHYRIDSIGSSVQSTKKVFCICDEFAEIERYLKKRPEKYYSLLSILMAVKFREYKWNYNRIDAVFQYAFLLRFAKEFKQAQELKILEGEVWKSQDWDELNLLLRDTEEYYSKTTKAVYEDQIKILKSRNARLSKIMVAQIALNASQVYICGNGKICDAVQGYLSSRGMNEKIAVFHDNKMYQPDFVNELVVGDTLFLIAVERQWQFGLQRKAEELGFKDIILCGEEWKDGKC